MKYFFPFIILAITTKCGAQEKITSNVSDVIVFLQGAQVTNKAVINIKPGDNTFTVKDLTPELDPNSIQVKGSVDYTILSVRHKINYLSNQSVSPEIQAKKDSLKELEFKLAMRQSMKSVFIEEKTMILANRSIKGTDANLLAEDIQEVADFYRNRLKEIEFRILELSVEEKDINESIIQLTNELNNLNARLQRSTSEIEIHVKSEKQKNSELEFTYVVSNAGWTPVYDIRARDIDSPVDLVYRAMVRQSTGFDWKNVRLTLSTGNPAQGGIPPALGTWYLYFNDPIVVQDYEKRQRFSETPQAMAEGEYQIAGKMAMEDPQYLSYKNIVQQGITNVEFQIGVPMTIPADNQGYDVEVQRFELPAEYRYLAIPKAEKDVFLMARARDWRQYNLLPGETNIFYQGTFVGKSFIDPSSTADTLELSLGRDNAVTIRRDMVKDFCKSSVLGSKKADSRAYKIKVANGKKKPISILIRDQVPVSTNAEIEVTIDELSGGKHFADTGFVEWELTMGSSESKELLLNYTVKYPKKRIIPNL
jgi:uncharacterized protein (TIGR02231 family)